MSCRTGWESAGPGRALRCAVAVDRASVEARMADLLRLPRWPPLDLGRLVAWFRAVGLDPVELTVGGPVVRHLRHGGDPHRAAHGVAQHRDWFDSQAAALAEIHPEVSLRALYGATDGRGELGVDLAVAAGALDAVRRRDDLGIDLVVVMSSDADFHRLHRYAAPVPLLVAGAFTDDELHRARCAATPRLCIPEDELPQLWAAHREPVTSGVAVTVREHRPLDDRVHDADVRIGDLVVADLDGPQLVVSFPLARAAVAPPPSLTGCRTVAAVDPYGMFNRAVASLGVGDLPDVASVRDLLGELGWDSPIGLFATLPDLRPDGMTGMADDLRAAWWSRDAQLDELADSYERDADPTTSVARSPLRADRVSHQGDGPTDRTAPSVAAKGLAVGLLADLWLARTTVPEAEAVLVSEHVDLLCALRLLPLCGIDTYVPVVRLAVHEEDDLDLPGGLEDVPDARPRHVLLVADQLAGLCRVADRIHGAVHRRLLFRGVEAGTPVRVTGVDPETGARQVVVRVRFDADGDGVPEPGLIESLAFGGGPLQLAADGSTLAYHRGREHLTVVFDHSSPCAHPVLMYRSRGLATAEGVVVDQEGSWITVDLDGDGQPDREVPIGHEALDFDPGRRVVLGLGAADHAAVADPMASLADRLDPEIVRVVSSRLTHWVVAALEDGESGDLVDRAGVPMAHADVDDVLYALRRQCAHGVEFVALSTPLAHLAEQLG